MEDLLRRLPAQLRLDRLIFELLFNLFQRVLLFFGVRSVKDIELFFFGDFIVFFFLTWRYRLTSGGPFLVELVFWYVLPPFVDVELEVRVVFHLYLAFLLSIEVAIVIRVQIDRFDFVGVNQTDADLTARQDLQNSFSETVYRAVTVLIIDASVEIVSDVLELMLCQREVLPLLKAILENSKCSIGLKEAIVGLLKLQPHHVQPLVEGVFGAAVVVHTSDLEQSRAHHCSTDVDVITIHILLGSPIHIVFFFADASQGSFTESTAASLVI